MKVLITTMVLLAALPVAAVADYAKITDRSQFVALVSGKTLTRPFVKLQVAPSGQISGKGASWAVSGAWKWQDGYFCRSLDWGGSDLGYNCQEVGVINGKLRFTSDQGRGDSAEFRLR